MEEICYPYLCDQLIEDLNQSMRDAGVRATVLEDARDGESLSVRLMLNDLAELDNVIDAAPEHWELLEAARYLEVYEG